MEENDESNKNDEENDERSNEDLDGIQNYLIKRRINNIVIT